MKIQDFLTEGTKQVKASDPKPKKIKPNKGNESPHPMRGKLVGESRPQKQKPYEPNKNQVNPVAKNSRNKSGAGAHKSTKDYDRKDKKMDIQRQLDEGPFIADRRVILDSILNKVRDLAYEDIQIIRKLAKMIGKDIRVKEYRHKKPGSVLALEHKELFTEAETDLLAMKCWDGYKKQGTKPGTGKNKGKKVNNCVKK
jgi:hypothetical protein|tara:strand:+ start:183 stop:776 length:594 start_codon:yes stop_codon:yes gene_type:complete